jgi:hypothetical protein
MFDRDKRSMVKNLCPWAVSFRLENSNSEALIEPNKSLSINNAEIETLVENGNVMFVGTGNGEHSRVYIENEELRKYFEFESEDGSVKQNILDKEKLEKIFSYKTIKTFKEHIEKEIVANHEKHIVMEYARKINENNYDRIKFLEEYTGLKFDEE